jgi:predicted Abi (CAAX) family protease
MRLRVLLMLAAVPLSLGAVSLAQPTNDLAKAEAEAEAVDDADAQNQAKVPTQSPAVTGGYSSLKPPPAPNADTSQPRRRLVTVFGTEACPKPTSSDEIVVCARLPDSEQYRIPEQLRQAQNQVSPFQANRKLLLGDASAGTTGAGAVGSCSTIGPGAQSGCNQQDIDAWAADRSSRMGYAEPVPPQ